MLSAAKNETWATKALKAAITDSSVWEVTSKEVLLDQGHLSSRAHYTLVRDGRGTCVVIQSHPLRLCLLFGVQEGEKDVVDKVSAPYDWVHIKPVLGKEDPWLSCVRCVLAFYQNDHHVVWRDKMYTFHTHEEMQAFASNQKKRVSPPKDLFAKLAGAQEPLPANLYTEDLPEESEEILEDTSTGCVVFLETPGGNEVFVYDPKEDQAISEHDQILAYLKGVLSPTFSLPGILHSARNRKGELYARASYVKNDLQGARAFLVKLPNRLVMQTRLDRTLRGGSRVARYLEKRQSFVDQGEIPSLEKEQEENIQQVCKELHEEGLFKPEGLDPAVVLSLYNSMYTPLVAKALWAIGEAGDDAEAVAEVAARGRTGVNYTAEFVSMLRSVATIEGVGQEDERIAVARKAIGETVRTKDGKHHVIVASLNPSTDIARGLFQFWKAKQGKNRFLVVDTDAIVPLPGSEQGSWERGNRVFEAVQGERPEGDELELVEPMYDFVGVVIDGPRGFETTRVTLDASMIEQLSRSKRAVIIPHLIL